MKWKRSWAGNHSINFNKLIDGMGDEADAEMN